MTDPANTQPRDLRGRRLLAGRPGCGLFTREICPAKWAILRTPTAPQCRELLIERFGYHILDYRLTSKGTCPKCGTAIPGRWGQKFEGQIADLPFLPPPAESQ